MGKIPTLIIVKLIPHDKQITLPNITQKSPGTHSRQTGLKKRSKTKIPSPKG